MSQTARVSVSLAILLAALLVLQLRSTGEAVPLRKALDPFPTTLGEWQAREGTILGAEILGKLKLTDYVLRDYVDGAGRELYFYIGYWDTQRKGAVIHSPKNCFPGKGWEPVEASLVTIPLRPPHPPIIVNRYLVQRDREEMVVLTGITGRCSQGEVPAKIAMVKNALVRNRTDGALVRVMGVVDGSSQETSSRLVAYIQALYPALGDYLPN